MILDDDQKAKIVLPVVHMNGTARQDLIDQRDAVWTALHAAMDALREMNPNGRDYYPEPGRMTAAEEQQRRRCLLLDQLASELEFEIEQLLTGGAK